MRSANGVEWEFDAGALCLELLLTGGDGDLAVWEVLHDADGLAAWLPGSSLGPIPGHPDTAHAGGSGTGHTGTGHADDAGHAPTYAITDADVRAVVELRRAIQGLADAVADGRPLRDADRAVVTAAAAGAPPAVALGPRGASLVSPVTGPQVVAAFARDAVALFGGPLRTRVRRCSADDCPLLFADVSRPGSRRWCSMQRCGNRAKQRARSR